MLSDPAQPAADLLAAVQARYELADVQGPDHLPGTHQQPGLGPYLAHGVVGQVAVDAAGLVVHMTTLATDTTTVDAKGPVVGAITTHRVSYSLRLMRKHPEVSPASGRPPTPQAITDASLILLRDTARMVDAAHAWADALPAHLEVGIGVVEPQGPSGEYAGNRLTVSLGPL